MRSLILGAMATLALYASANVAADEGKSAGATAIDRLDVIELSSRYAWGIDTLDRDLLAHTFAPDAVAEYKGVGEPRFNLDEHLEGFDAIFAWLQKNLGSRSGWKGVPMHFVQNHLVELQGDSATLKFYMHNRAMSAGGIYTFKAIRTPAGWRISRLLLQEQLWKPEAYSGDSSARSRLPTTPGK